MDSYLCTVDIALEELRSKNTASPSLVKRRIPVISRRIEQIAGLWFEPVYGTETITPSPQNVSSADGTLHLGMPLLELIGVTVDGRALTLDTQVRPEIVSGAPAKRLRLVSSACSSWYGSSQDSTVTVTGWWGYRVRYATEGWKAIEPTAAAMTTSTDTLTVGANKSEAWLSARYGVGTLVRIDDEMTRIDDRASHVITLERGVRGTTPAAHASGSSLRAWQVENDILHACLQGTLWSYSRQGTFETTRIADVGVISSPTDLPREVYSILQRYMNL